MISKNLYSELLLEEETYLLEQKNDVVGLQRQWCLLATKKKGVGAYECTLYGYGRWQVLR